MNKIKLQKYIDYKAMYDVAVTEPYMYSFKKLKEYIGSSEDKVLILEEGLKDLKIDDFNYQGRIVTYHNPEQIEKVGKTLFEFLKDDDKWNNLIEKISSYEKELDPVMNIKSTNDILDKAKTDNLYSEIYSKYFELYLEIITIYLITDGRYHEFSIKELEKHGIDSNTINQLTLPNKLSSFQIANQELNEIGKLFRDSKDWEERFEKFVDKYIWFYLADTHYNFEQVVEELKGKLKDSSEDEESESRKSDSIKNKDISDVDKKILDRISELGFLRMELRKYWQWIDYTIHTLLYNFGKDNNIPEKTLVFLMNDEVKEVLSREYESLDAAVKKAQDRTQLLAVFLNDDEINIYDESKKINDLRDNHVIKEDFEKILKGNIAYKDEEKVVGTARVITWSEDIINELKKVEKDEILVVTQTKPDFIPFLKGIKAIVSDEGGITSHVSIISRELKIPAIIGTRTATDSIKTGDSIELDMISGEVYKV